MIRIILLSIGIFGSMILNQINAYACSCPSLGKTFEQELKDRLKSSNNVFSGEVIEIKYTEDIVYKIDPITKSQIALSVNHAALIKIKIEKSWKEILPEEITKQAIKSIVI